MYQLISPWDKKHVCEIVFTSDTELASVDWDVGMEVVNVSSGERRQLLGPTIFVRLSCSLSWVFTCPETLPHCIKLISEMQVCVIESCGDLHLTQLSPPAHRAPSKENN